jgi:hypothetical protein
MPESNKAAKKREQKANRLAGIGDENGRRVRVKEPPKTSQCSVCQQIMTITKSNTELNAHSTSKHGKTIEECFPGAKEAAAELLAGAKKTTGGKGGSGGLTKAQQKQKASAGMDDMLSAGLKKR